MPCLNYLTLHQVFFKKLYILLEEAHAAKSMIDHLVPEWYKAKGGSATHPSKQELDLDPMAP